MSVLSVKIQQKIEDLLISDKVISEPKLAEYKRISTETNEPLLGLLLKDNIISNEQLVKYNSHANGIGYVNLRDIYVDQKILDLLPRDIAEHYMAVPVGEHNNALAIAMLDGSNLQAIDFLSQKIGRPLKVYQASEEGIKTVLKQYKIKIDENDASKFNAGEITDNIEQESNSESYNNTVKTISQDSPISKILSNILEYAATNLASDVHIEPYEKDLKVRARIDGVLREIMKLPKNTEAALISRVKIISNLKIDEHRVPQDGESTINIAGKNIDLRIAIAPVIWGEQVVIRLLDKSSIILKLEDMGYSGRSLRVVRGGLTATNGMILTSGPTGSGKSTSMYAMLQEVVNESVNIVTLEDPVEYKMPGVNQIQVNNEVGLTFATGLRSILRQDPDIIMVGEIRDKETAELAIQAALTGHLVFSTLHTNSAAGILPRLLDMGIEPFLIASTIKVVIGQRLVRRVANERDEYNSLNLETFSINNTVGKYLPKNTEESAAIIKDMGYKSLPVFNETSYELYKGKDSPRSPLGFKGRVGIYEAFEISNAIQDLVLKRATSDQIEKEAKKSGMVTMREDGYLKALNGLTTIQEVDRVAAEDIS